MRSLRFPSVVVTTATSFLFLAFLAAGEGCAAYGTAGSRGVSEDPKIELQRLRGEQAFLRRRVEALETAAAGSSSAPSRPGKTARPPPLDVIVLRPGDRKVSEFSNEPEEKTWAREEREPAADRGKAFRSDGENLYARAASLMTTKQYTEAANVLTELLVRSPDHADTESALFLLGECSLAISDWTRASEQFEGLLARFPRGKKAPDALARLALSYRHRGDDVRARELTARLRSMFPSSPAARATTKE